MLFLIVLGVPFYYLHLLDKDMGPVPAQGITGDAKVDSGLVPPLHPRPITIPSQVKPELGVLRAGTQRVG
jgi:hypothetical protein